MDKVLRDENLILILLLFVIITSVSFALMKPSGDPQKIKVSGRGRDVVILLDVSRSMDAKDLVPGRLERSKIEISEALNKMEGDRVALAAFAGSTVLKCPLTTDHAFLRLALEEISTSSVSRGGTLIGDALRYVNKNIYNEDDSKNRDIILITDGEDHESFPLEAAEAIGERGIRLMIIGLGSTTGTEIPLGNGNYLTYNNKRVISRLDSKTLKEMASKTPGGKYLQVGTGSFNLAEIYEDLVSSAGKTNEIEEDYIQYEEMFQLYLIPAVLAFTALFALFIIRKTDIAELLKTDSNNEGGDK